LATILIFVRHGESEGNKLNRFNGSLNMPLTEKGKLQAQKTAEYLDKCKIEKIYASDLSRAKETAQIIANRNNLQVILDKNLREINGGDFEGKLYEDLQKLYPKEYAMWQYDLGNCTCPNGESIRELLKRFNKRIIEIVKENQHKTIVIATHAMPIRAISTVWYKKDITQIRDFDFVKNASVSVVDYTDIQNPVVLEYDHADHLNELVTKLPQYI